MPNYTDNTNGWGEWSKHVLKELERLADAQELLEKGVNDIRIEIALLKVKSGVWGAAAGLIPCVITIIVLWIRSMM